jgi:hypothetical protein
VNHSEEPFKELRKAQEAVEAMRPRPRPPATHPTPPKPEVYEREWKNLLSALERLWGKANSHFGKSREWKAWSEEVVRLRRTDPVLRYLRVARNVDEHTIEPIADREVITKSLEATRTVSYDEKGRIVPSPFAKPPRLIVTAHRMRLLSVKDRNETIPVPDSHLGSPIEGHLPLVVAEAGVRFYADLLERAEKRFVG